MNTFKNYKYIILSLLILLLFFFIVFTIFNGKNKKYEKFESSNGLKHINLGGLPKTNNTQKNINKYIEVKKFLSHNQIKKMFDIIKNLNLKLINGTIDGKETVEPSKRVNKVLWIPFNDETKWLYNIITKKTLKVNNENFQFTNIEGYPSIQISYYYGNVSGHYDWHCDIGNWPAIKRTPPRMMGS